MREIKFRAWDKEHEEMLYPDNTEKILFAINEHGIKTYDMREDPDEYQNLAILDTVVMQYTGMKDKNGKEIYEGDILYFEPFETSINNRVVEFYNGGFVGRLVRNGYFKPLGECDYEVKVVGNIYENPEILDPIGFQYLPDDPAWQFDRSKRHDQE